MYILPSDTREVRLGQARNGGIVRRYPRLAGTYINSRFVIPTNSLSPRLSGAVVNEVYTRPPYRSLQGLGQSWFDEEMIPGVKNLYLALGGGALLLLMMGGGRRR
jgi:hypothetical protein